MKGQNILLKLFRISDLTNNIFDSYIGFISTNTYNILSFLVLTKLYSIEFYGSTQIIYISLGLVGILSLPYLNNLIQISAGEKKYDRILILLKTRTQLAILSFLIATIIYLIFFAEIFQSKVGMIILLFLSIFGSYGLNWGFSILSGFGHFKKVKKIRIITSIIGSLGLFFLYQIKINSPYIFVFQASLIETIGNIIACFFGIKILIGFRKANKFDSNTKVLISSLIKFEIISGIANELGNRIFSIMIFYFLGPTSLGIYMVAEKITELIKKLFEPLWTPIQTNLVKKKANFQKIPSQFLNKFINLITLVPIILIWPILYFIKNTEIGSTYIDSSIYIAFLIPTLSLQQYSKSLAVKFNAYLLMNHTKQISIITNLVRVLTSLLLIPLLGLNGAIISTVSYRISMAFMFWKKRNILLMREYV